MSRKLFTGSGYGRLNPGRTAFLQLTSQWALNASTGVFQQVPEYISLIVQDDRGRYINSGLPYIHADHYVAGLEREPDEYLRLRVYGGPLGCWQPPGGR